MPKPKEAKLSIERIGGVAAFGVGHLKSAGELAWTELSAEDQAAVDALFARTKKPKRDLSTPEERYLITRKTPKGEQTVEVIHSDTPPALRAAVKDQIV
jgi:TRAP-type C4-dicarboxylate transport system substrate-binding protein